MITILKKMINKKKPVLGIDLGADSLKLIEVQRDKQVMKIKGMAKVPTPANCIVDGIIKERDKLAEALLALFTKANTSTNDVNILINGKNVVIRQVKLPIMPEKEVKQALEWEVDKYLPMQRQEMFLDYINFGEMQSASNKQLNILVAAAPKDLLYSYYEVFAKAGLHLNAIEIVPIALGRAIYSDYKFKNVNEALIVLDVRAQSSTVIIYHEDILVFTRTIPFGGNEIDKSIAKMLSISEEEARELKEKQGIIEPDKDVLGFPESFEDKVQFSIKGALRELVQEVQRSISFFQVQHREAQINKLFISGGMANMLNISVYLERALGMPVQVCAPEITGLELFPEYTIDDTKLDPSFLTVLGLACREVE